MKARIAALALLVSAGAAPAQEKQEVPALEKRVTLELQGTLAESIDLLRKQTGARLMIDESDGLDLQRRVDLRFKDMTGLNALRWITRLHGADFHITPEAIALITARRSRCGGAAVRRTYETRAFQRDASDRPGGRIDIPDARILGLRLTPLPKRADDDVTSGCPILDQLVDLIKENIAPGTWEGDQTLDRDLRGRILANCPLEIHRQIEKFLKVLDSVSRPSATVTATIADARDAVDPILECGMPRIVASDEINAILARLRERSARELEVTGVDTQRVHSLTRKESSGPISIVRGAPVVKNQVADIGLLDVRPCVSRGARGVQVELRLSLGQTRDLEPAQTPSGALPLHERLVTRLGTTFVIPRGGGVLFALPARDRSRPVPQICLLRADAGTPEPEGPRRRLLAPEPSPDEESTRLEEKLAKAPSGDLTLENAPASALAAWIYERGFSVVVEPELAEEKISVRAKSISPAAVLRLVLGPRQWDYRIVDGAILIGSRMCSRMPIRLSMLDVRDVGYPAADFGRESGETGGWAIEDLCNLIKNTVHRSNWEEADGKSIQTSGGIVFIRNTEPMIRECEKFIDEQRSPSLKRVALRAEILSLPAAEVEAVTRNKAARTFMIEEAQRTRLLDAGQGVERIAWISFEGQRTLLEWERAREYLHEVSGDTATLQAALTTSFLEVCPTLDKDGATFGVSVACQDQRLVDLREGKTRDGTLESPAMEEIATRARIEIPSGRIALFRWTLPEKDGEPRRSHLLVLTPTLIP